MYNLNINKSSVVPTNLIVGRVLDKPFDVFQFKIFNGLDPLDLTSSTIDFRGVTPDNKKVISTDIKIIDAKSGEIEFKIPSNFYSASGKFRNAYFRITKSGQTESTNDLLINVLNAVDLNLDDSQIIIDRLDKIIEDAIAKLDKELANVKLQISQVDGNIKALKKDVEDYKATFKVQMDAMQKQLDELSKAINQTDIQRPQITKSNGSDKITINNINKTLMESVIEMGVGVGLHTITIMGCKDNPSKTWLRGHINVRVSGEKIQYYTILQGMSSHEVYSQVVNNGTDLGWRRLDGQVPKVTNDDGNELIRFDDSNMSSFDAFRNQIRNGLQSVYVRQLKDAPASPLIGMYVATHGGVDGTFIGVRMTTGETYTYSHNGTSGRWVRLDNVGYNNASQSKDGLMSSTDKKKLDDIDNLSNGFRWYNQSDGYILNSSNIDILTKRSSDWTRVTMAINSPGGVSKDGFYKSVFSSNWYGYVEYIDSSNGNKYRNYYKNGSWSEWRLDGNDRLILPEPIVTWENNFQSNSAHTIVREQTNDGRTYVEVQLGVNVSNNAISKNTVTKIGTVPKDIIPNKEVGTVIYGNNGITLYFRISPSGDLFVNTPTEFNFTYLKGSINYSI